MNISFTRVITTIAAAAIASCIFYSCKPKGAQAAITGDAASKAYVAPGKYDEFYNIVSGGFNGQIGIFG